MESTVTHEPTIIAEVKRPGYRTVALSALTPQSAAYVRKTLHPPGPRDGYCGRPTSKFGQAVVFEAKGNSNHTPVFYDTAGGVPFVSNPDTMLLLNVPGGDVASYVFYRTATGTYSQQSQIGALAGQVNIQAPASLSEGFSWVTRYPIDVAAHMVDYKSTTIYANTTEFNNQGRIATSTFVGDVVRKTASTLIAGHNRASRQNFLRASGLPLDTIFPSELDDLDFTHVQASKTPTKDGATADFATEVLWLGSSNGTASAATSNYLIQNVLPETVAAVSVYSPSATDNLFKDGQFIVTKDATEEQDFCPRPVNNNATGIPNLPVKYLGWYNPALNQYFYVALYTRPPLTSAQIPAVSQDIPWTSKTFSWTIIQGLTIPSAATATGSLPGINIKTITGYAVVPDLDSSLRVNMQTLAFADYQAIQLLANIQRELPDAQLAAANDFGSVAKTLLSIAPGVIDTISGLFSKKKSGDENKTSNDKVLAMHERMIQGLRNDVNMLKARLTPMVKIAPNPPAPKAQQPKPAAPRKPTTKKN